MKNKKRPILSLFIVFIVAFGVSSGTYETPTLDELDPIAQEFHLLEIGTFENATGQIDYRTETGLSRTLHYPGAAFIKVHFAKLDLAPGDFVTVSNPERAEVYTYFTDPTVERCPENSMYTTDESGRFWAMSVRGDTAVVQLHRSDASCISDEDLDRLGVSVDKFTRGYSQAEIDEKNAHLRSICGNNDMQDAACYRDSHPIYYEQGWASALLVLRSGRAMCTSWRIGSANHMLTNNHCVSNQGAVDGAEVWFGNQYTECDGNVMEEEVKTTGDQYIISTSTYDMALYTVNTDVDIKPYGYLLPQLEPAQNGEEIYILQHPGGRPTEFGVESDVDSGGICVVANVGSSAVSYRCDTEPGSSGSSVLAAATNKVVALHNLGGCPSGTNSGNRMDLIWDEIDDEVPIASCDVDTPGEGWELDQNFEYEITWTFTEIETVNIELYKGGALDSQIASSVDAADGAFTWLVPADQEIGDDYAIRITSTADENISCEKAVSITEPGNITEFPYIQDFEEFSEGTTELTEFWKQLRDDELEWNVQSGPAPIEDGETEGCTGPDADHTTGDDGIYLYVEASGENAPELSANNITPLFDLSGLQTPYLEFWYHMFSDNNGEDQMGDLRMDMWVDGAWEEAVLLSGDQGDEWLKETVDLTDQVGETIRIRFRGMTGSGWASDICIDDFIINDIPAFVSEPETEAEVDAKYKYEIEARDDDPASVRFVAEDVPGFLELQDNEDGTAVLKGTPQEKHIGEHDVVLTLTDGLIEEPIEQTFTLEVTGADGDSDGDADSDGDGDGDADGDGDGDGDSDSDGDGEGGGGDDGGCGCGAVGRGPEPAFWTNLL